MSDETNAKESCPSPRSRARARHILDNYYIGPARDASILEIWAYTERFSYEPGETVGLRVSTTAETWDMEISRDGGKLQSVLTVQNLPGVFHETPEDCSVKGCDWPTAYSFEIPLDWKPGGYLFKLTGRKGAAEVQEHHLILVRRAQATKQAPILLLCATGTWVAYNCWGGSNAYEGITGADGKQFSPILSTQRPWSRGFCWLPTGAPRALPEAPPRVGDMVRYHYMEWAYAYGYSKKYASAGWASYERHFAKWAETQGYTLDYATLHDLHDDPELLDGYECVVCVGHDEYWSREMRLAIDTYVENGGHVARFAGNFLWQIRLEEYGRTQICYKYIATETDPVRDTNDSHLLTGAWEQPEVNWPGAQTFGANGSKGVYAGLGNCVGRGSGGFTIYRPGHWALNGAHLGYGDVLGASSRIYGYEVDGLDHVIRDGLPFATGKDGASTNIEIIGLGLGTNAETDHGVTGETLYIGKSDAEWKARAMYGSLTPETYDTALRGNGVMVHWQRGKGEIFNAATCEWVMGLARKDFQVEMITRNVLDRFSGRS
ncbi:N,N-dimethylformamidase beta subunit family domain-containing protein [Ruegeria arenilitoris]|uniref:N,N-dimethylformamidase beta subunit family domain-containing protein n=1 Tax=Ruegeria arenilitoris TaxID=1173585 RepID=UPI00147D4E02|nr:N,N-dimethylformamidase beta subunit family domain-containing protein [Ruegeria arenilitoris]